MTIKIGINGFGRIGRCVLRAIAADKSSELEVVHINDLTDTKTLAHLLKYDSVHRNFTAQPVGHSDKGLSVGSKDIGVTSIRDPREIPWKSAGASIIFECTGVFRDRETAGGHLAAGADKVIISAPAKNHDLTVVVGVNDHLVKPEHQVLSNGSCTTNCLAPVAKVMLDTFGIKNGLMTTIHSYTNDQHLLDLPHRKGDLRRSRAAAVSMVPTSTGAAKAISQVIPELSGKLDGMAVRVPTADVSLVDLSVTTEKSVSVDTINAAMKKAASTGPLANVLRYTEEELVSSDYIGEPASSVFDATLTKTSGEHLAKVFSWYDNEWGFSCRMIDLARIIAKKG